MKQCERCRVTVAGSAVRCPLCQHTLTDNGDGCQPPDVFPNVQGIYNTHEMFFRVLLFVLIAISVITVMLDLMLPERDMWSLFVVAGAVCVWLGVLMAIRRRGNFHKRLLDCALLVLPLSLLWDYLTGWHLWSVEYVIPIFLMCCMAVAVIVAWVLHLPPDRFVIYLLILMLLGALPAVLLAVGLCNQTIPSFLCVTTSLLLLAAQLVFRWELTTGEMRRRLHF